jgi:hypothetical protein
MCILLDSSPQYEQLHTSFKMFQCFHHTRLSHPSAEPVAFDQSDNDIAIAVHVHHLRVVIPPLARRGYLVPMGNHPGAKMSGPRSISQV